MDEHEDQVTGEPPGKERVMISFIITFGFLITGFTASAYADLSDCGVSDVVVIANDTFTAGSDISCSATVSITVGPAVTIGNGARFSLAAPLIELTPLVRIENGAAFYGNTGATPTATGRLNDSGILSCADASLNDLACPQTGYPGQDAEYGRDVTHNDDSDGHAGFSFTKLDGNGNPVPADATHWSCVRDNVTGLIWEVKTDDGGLQDKDWSYSWYNPDSSVNGGEEGTQDAGSCAGSSCDTRSYVQAINSRRLCGAADWRMPMSGKGELRNIVSLDRLDPSIDTDYFPGTVSRDYWTGSSNGYDSRSAFRVDFDDGSESFASKSYGKRVRLVRGGR